MPVIPPAGEKLFPYFGQNHLKPARLMGQRTPGTVFQARWEKPVAPVALKQIEGTITQEARPPFPFVQGMAGVVRTPMIHKIVIVCHGANPVVGTSQAGCPARHRPGR